MCSTTTAFYMSKSDTSYMSLSQLKPQNIELNNTSYRSLLTTQQTDK